MPPFPPVEVRPVSPPPIIVLSSDEEDAVPPPPSPPVADPLPMSPPSPVDEICHICADRTLAGITNCGHRFCGECLSHYQATQYRRITCPDCRTPITAFYRLPGTNPHNFVPLDLVPQNVVRPPSPPPETFIGRLFLAHWGVTPNGEGIFEFPHTHLIRCRVCDSIVRNEAHRRYRHVLRCFRSPFHISVHFHLTFFSYAKLFLKRNHYATFSTPYPISSHGREIAVQYPKVTEHVYQSDDYPPDWISNHGGWEGLIAFSK